MGHGIGLKSDTNNPWFKPRFNILLHTQSIVSATVYTLCESDERYQSQYRFVNLLESDLNKFLKSISTMILRPHRRPFEKINIENEAFAL